MVLIVNKILGALWLLSLLGIANMAPFLAKGINFLNIPVDFEKNWKGQRIFGDNKTWRGIFSAILAAFLWFALQKLLFENSDFLKKISFFDYSLMPFYYSFLVGLGVILGDLIKSFFKRRAGIASGKPWIPFDQIDYLLGGIVFGLYFFVPSALELFLILFSGIILHILFNLIGYFLKIKNEMF